jgi:hypothetical protein
MNTEAWRCDYDYEIYCLHSLLNRRSGGPQSLCGEGKVCGLCREFNPDFSLNPPPPALPLYMLSYKVLISSQMWTQWDSKWRRYSRDSFPSIRWWLFSRWITAITWTRLPDVTQFGARWTVSITFLPSVIWYEQANIHTIWTSGKFWSIHTPTTNARKDANSKKPC